MRGRNGKENGKGEEGGKGQEWLRERFLDVEKGRRMGRVKREGRDMSGQGDV